MTSVKVSLAVLAAIALPQVAAAQYKGLHTGVTLIDHPWAHPGQHVENISEEGYGEIFGASALLASNEGLRVALTSQGGITESYGVDPCSLPTTDDKQRERNRVCRQATEGRQKAWMAFLRVQADADGSGFVTTEEAMVIYHEVKTAFRVAKLRIDTPEGLLQLPECRRQGREGIVAELAAYARLREQALKENLTGMPDLPAPLAKAVQSASTRTPASD
jgi:hypothetical protein